MPQPKFYFLPTLELFLRPKSFNDIRLLLARLYVILYILISVLYRYTIIFGYIHNERWKVRINDARFFSNICKSKFDACSFQK